MAPADPRLLESSRHGTIPKIATDGAKAYTVYAQPRPLPAALKDMPRIAIVIGGLGIRASGTAEGLLENAGTGVFPRCRLTRPMSEKMAERARGETRSAAAGADGAVRLPDNDPGPQTLLTSVTAEQNVDRLQWLMSRFRGLCRRHQLYGRALHRDRAGADAGAE